MNSRQVIKLIEQAGWRFQSSRGSHHQFTHPMIPGRVTVVHAKKDVSIGMLKSIERQSSVKLRKR
ncbi:type II toxin-antitoxin system HicA family toxin [Novosphingopyxis sp.]|uniref:type II toxin-antitoxin system HicA family toxin n=1 Tax=Novosphingopyxis sp. TaxID=2709690 RepID=UPI003B597429